MTQPDRTSHHTKWAAAVSRLAGSGEEASPPPPAGAPVPDPQATANAPAAKSAPKGVLNWLSGLLGGGQRLRQPAARPQRNTMGARAREPEDTPPPQAHRKVSAEIRREVLAYREDGHVVADEADLCRILARRFWPRAGQDESHRLCDEALNGLAREGALQRFAVGEVSMCYLKFR